MAIKTTETNEANFLISDIFREIISNRLSLNIENSIENQEEIVKSACDQIKEGLPTTLHIFLRHSHGANKWANQELEVWTFLMRNSASEAATSKAEAGILPTFLKQAIRSQLYFSPLKSWFSQINELDRCKIKICIKVSKNQRCCIIPEANDSHTFPPCYLTDGHGRHTFSIDFRWLNRASLINNISRLLKSDVAQENALQRPDTLSIENKIEKEQLTGSRLPKNNSNEKDRISPRRRLEPAEGVITDGLIIKADEKHEIKTSSGYSLYSPPRFNPRTRLPLNSSPIPPLLPQRRKKLPEKINQITTDKTKSNSELVNNIEKNKNFGENKEESTLKAARKLLCNFEESALNGCLLPASTPVNGFRIQLVAGMPSKHITLPVQTYYYHSSEDFQQQTGENPFNTTVHASLHMGYCSLPNLVKIQKRCTIQAVLFNPQGSVVKIFLVDVDVRDMPSNSRTFIRQRTFSGGDIATSSNENDDEFLTRIERLNLGEERVTPTTPNKFQSQTKILRFLIHFRIISDEDGSPYLHSDIRMLFSNKANDLEGLDENTFKNIPGVNNAASFQMAVCEMPSKPKYSPVK